jgi:uncharacterized protein (TIRG00374 family)
VEPDRELRQRYRPGRLLAYGLLLAGFVLVAVTNRSDASAAIHAFRSVRWSWMALAFVAAAAWSVNLAGFHASAQRAAGLRTRTRDLLGAALACNFLNLVTKSGGMAGLAALRAEARRRQRPLGGIAAAYVLVIVLGDVGFAATLAVAMVVVAADGRLSAADVIALVVFAIYVALRLAAFVSATKSRQRVRQLYALPHRIARRFGGRVPDAQAHAHSNASADELFDSMVLVRTRRRAVARVLPHALLVEAIGISMLWAVMEAVGITGGPVRPFLGYSVSVLFTIVGLLPAGLGFVEVSLGAVLISYGAPAGKAAAAVVLYRVLELWLPMAVGAIAAARVRRAGRRDTEPMPA